MSVCEEHSSQSRQELLAWLSGAFNVKVSRPEQLVSGAIYCQALQSLRPDLLYLKRSAPSPKTDQEISKNFHLVQLTLEKFGLIRRLPIDKLTNGSWPEHHELLLQLQKAQELSLSEKPGKRSKSVISTNVSTRSSTPTPMKTDVNCVKRLHELLTRERDFYFGKLSKVEALLQSTEEPLAQALLELIYSSEEVEEQEEGPSRLPHLQL